VKQEAAAQVYYLYMNLDSLKVSGWLLPVANEQVLSKGSQDREDAIPWAAYDRQTMSRR
jgi:hypothetical protein